MVDVYILDTREIFAFNCNIYVINLFLAFIIVLYICALLYSCITPCGAVSSFCKRPSKPTCLDKYYYIKFILEEITVRS